MYLKRKKRERMNVRPPERIECPSHAQWARGFDCSVKGRAGHECEGRMDPHHHRLGTDGGTSLRPSDSFVVPLCRRAHDELDAPGSGPRTFEAKYGVNLRLIADTLWQKSPHRRRWELKMQREYGVIPEPKASPSPVERKQGDPA